MTVTRLPMPAEVLSWVRALAWFCSDSFTLEFLDCDRNPILDLPSDSVDSSPSDEDYDSANNNQDDNAQSMQSLMRYDDDWTTICDGETRCGSAKSKIALFSSPQHFEAKIQSGEISKRITHILSLHSASFRGWMSRDQELCSFFCTNGAKNERRRHRQVRRQA